MLTELQTEKQATINCGEKTRSFCYLPTALCRLNLSFCWKESHPKFQGKIIATAVLDKDENCL